MLNRFSQREKMAFQTYNIYKEIPTVPICDSLPESVGENRDFLPDETMVALGYVKNEEHFEWIKKTKLYNFRANSLDSLLNLNRKLSTIRYILLHSGGNSIKLVRLDEKRPHVFKRSELLEKGYPKSTDEENKKDMNDRFYLVYHFREIDLTEPEWSKYCWKISDLTDKKGYHMADLDVVKLSELMQKAKKK